MKRFKVLEKQVETNVYHKILEFDDDIDDKQCELFFCNDDYRKFKVVSNLSDLDVWDIETDVLSFERIE